MNHPHAVPKQRPTDPGIPASVLEAQVAALMQRVETDRERRCSELRASTEKQARDLERAARKEARANVREAVVRERKHAEQALRQAEASTALKLRQHAQQLTRDLLQAMWSKILGMLEAAWADAARRECWIRTAVGQAKVLMSERALRIGHGAGWSDAERGALAELAAEADPGVAPREIELVLDPAIRAGIKIRTAGVCLDATAAGLLASREEIESEFLARCVSSPVEPAVPVHEART
jgi:hypothetical protein